MDNYKVSVVIITYNHADFIMQAIESVAKQVTDFEYEIVIHDDASNDGTETIINAALIKYPGRIRYIRQVINQYSQGVQIAALAYSYASAPLIAVCEGDDFWHAADKLQKQFDYMSVNTNCGAVFSDADILFENTKEIVKCSDGRRNYFPPVGDVRHSLILGNPYKSCTVMFRKDAVLGYAEHANRLRSKMEDYVIWLHLSMGYEIGYIPSSLATYRVLQSSASHFLNWHDKIKFDKSAYKVSMYFNKLMGSPVKKDCIKSAYSYSLFIYFIRKKMIRHAFFYFRCSPFFFKLIYRGLYRYLISKRLS